MSPTQHDEFFKIVKLQRELTDKAIDYWHTYSTFSSWQFWAVVLLLIGPLIVLYVKIDREYIFQIGFFGFATHVLFSYIDILGIRFGLWGYPFQIIPALPSLSLDASIIPVSIMLVYQWTLHRQKNYYVYALITAIIFGFIFKPILVSLDLFEKYEWVNYFYIFIIYLVLFVLPYWGTSFFKWMKEKEVT